MTKLKPNLSEMQTEEFVRDAWGESAVQYPHAFRDSSILRHRQYFDQARARVEAAFAELPSFEGKLYVNRAPIDKMRLWNKADVDSWERECLRLIEQLKSGVLSSNSDVQHGC